MSSPYATFRPYRSRIVAIVSAVVCVVIFTVVAFTVPRGGANGWAGTDSMMFILFGLLIAAFLMRYAVVKAVPTEDGVAVRNLLSTRTVEWAEVVNVQFGGGAPWLLLELTDTEHLAVMAIQRSDGARAEAEAGRMAALVQVNSAVATR